MVEKKFANPGPLGLLGFGTTTILLNLHNADIIPLSIVIIGMGVALGGLAQLIAGIFEMKQGNTFAGTAFIAYGAFWWSLVIIWTLAPAGLEAEKISMGYYLLIKGYRDWETDRKSTRLISSHSGESRMPSSA